MRVKLLGGRDVLETDLHQVADGDGRRVVGPIEFGVSVSGDIEDSPFVVSIAMRVEGDLLLYTLDETMNVVNREDVRLLPPG
jgi:hypothetical protein